MILVRKMLEEDVVPVAELEAQIFSQPWSEQGFSDSLHLADTVFLVAERQGVILGYIGMYVSMGEGEITNVAVSPAERGCGIGAMLISEIKKEAERRSVGTLILEVRVSNDRAIRLYERNGFLNRGIRRGFYERPKEDAYIMIYGQ